MPATNVISAVLVGATAVAIGNTGLWNLNGFNQTISNASFQNALAIQDAATVETGAGTLTLNGDLNYTAGAILNVVVPAFITGNLNVGSSGLRTFNIANNSGNIRYGLEIAANISGSASIHTISNGGILFSGNNTYTGDTFLEAGPVGLGSSSAFGTGTIANDNATLYAENAAQTISNPMSMDNTDAVGASDDLTFTGLITINGDRTLNVNVADMVTIAGGLGEALVVNQNFRKGGPGILNFTSAATFGGVFVMNGQGAGTVMLSGVNGALLDYSVINNVNAGNTLQLDNSFGNNSNRLRDQGTITTNGSIVYIGDPGQASTEILPAINLVGGWLSTVTVDCSTISGSSVVLTSPQLGAAGNGEMNFVGEGVPLGTAPGAVGAPTAN